MSLYIAKGGPDLELSTAELKSLLYEALGKLGERCRVLVVPPDQTRFHSRAGDLTPLAGPPHGETRRGVRLRRSTPRASWRSPRRHARRRRCRHRDAVVHNHSPLADDRSARLHPAQSRRRTVRTWCCCSGPRPEPAAARPSARRSCRCHRSGRCRRRPFPSQTCSGSARGQRPSRRRSRRA